jgi:FAD/FMN-containing dehydrogenase
VNKKEAWNMHQPVENAAYGLATHDLWEANVAWVRECVADMQRFSDGGMYLNFPGFLEEGQGMMRDAYGENYERLVALKDEYDPTNLFRINQNVRPTR